MHPQSLDRCYLVDDTLARLARRYPDVKFLRARASALGFASTGPARPLRLHQSTRASRNDDEDSDPSDEEQDDEEGESEDDDNVDLDMLPTMLVYRDGDLVQTWVRVDWEAGPTGIEELLDRSEFYPSHSISIVFIIGGRHRILTHPESLLQAPIGDEEEDFDLIWSDDDVDLI